MNGQRGQTIPLIALALTVLFGAASLAVDVGYWRYQQRVEQSAADSAAVAAAGELAWPSAADVVAAARKDATTNGFTDDGGTTTRITVNNPPLAGNYAGNARAVEVVIAKKQPLWFAGVFGSSAQWVSVRAVALLNTSGAYCIYALNGDITLFGGGEGGIEAPQCGLVTNQDLVVTGMATVDASLIGYVGLPPSGGSYTLAQPQKSLPVTDPCPTIAGCAYLTDLTLHHPELLHTGCMTYPGPDPLPPGEYCTQLSGTIHFAPGLFVLDHGMAGGDVSGTGVTIYNGDSSGLTFSGNVNWVVTAPTSGPTAGIVYYQAAGNTGGITKNGSSGSVNLSGGFYAPSADMLFNGALPSISLLVVKSLRMNGGGITVPAAGMLQRSGHGTLAE
ncbi:MAG TPA: pilus assembly protein TadG-related protein [Dongiaceae bacterium]|nr:pilus assembly protein TadG-related protein [Mycobacteriales bacterium]HYW54369.1 pilus assembly protein TadG-related protein [Dongiaceae bacterium]